MARKRMIDPSFWDDLTVGQLSREARLCFLGLLSYADDYGRIEVDARYVKRAVFGFDDDLDVSCVGAILDELQRSARNLRFYVADGREVAVFLNWQRYQYIQKPQASRLPPPPPEGDVATATIPVTDPYDTATVPVTASRAFLRRIEQNRIEINTPAAIAPAHEDPPPPPPADDLADRLGKYGVSNNQLRKVRAAFQSKSHKLTTRDLDQVDAFMQLPKKTVGILLGSWLYEGNLPPVPLVNGHTNGLSPPRKPQPDLHEEQDELGNVYLALADGTPWESDL